ncbi:hypothetical protein WG908_12295 [Sphingobium sp. AN641]|uniref:hypothetical protein n=1 Tax=Sphingobium sp. AN641 TaxID=3133443 RepID=UPI0030BF1EE7
MRHDAKLAIRADLMQRIDALAAQGGHLSVPRIHDEVDQIRYTARAFHFDALERLADTLESALSVNGHGPVVLSYLDLMRETLARDIEPAAMPLAHIAAASAPAQLRA